MKVAILTHNYSPHAGMARVAEAQAKELTSQGHRVAIFTFQAHMKPPHNVDLQTLYLPKGFLLQRVYYLLFPLNITLLTKWLPRLKEFDIIYSYQYPMNWLAYLAKQCCGAEYIYYNHGYAPPDTFPTFIERTYGRIVHALANWTIKRADGAISVSQYLQKELKRETGLDSELSYNKIDSGRFYPGIDGSRIRENHNLGNAPVVLFVGRISPHKGVHLLIEAFELVKREVPEARLIVVGKHFYSNYSKKLKQMSDDSIIFAEDVPDEELPYYYAACDVYATASLWEGFDIPVAEAQACGKPVVAFDIGPHPEVVNTKEGGELVQPGNIEGLAKAIVKICRKAKTGSISNRSGQF